MVDVRIDSNFYLANDDSNIDSTINKNDIFNYRGYFQNNNQEEEEQKFFEFGAHFPYYFLVQKLDILKTELESPHQHAKSTASTFNNATKPNQSKHKYKNESRNILIKTNHTNIRSRNRNQHNNNNNDEYSFHIHNNVNKDDKSKSMPQTPSKHSLKNTSEDKDDNNDDIITNSKSLDIDNNNCDDNNNNNDTNAKQLELKRPATVTSTSKYNNHNKNINNMYNSFASKLKMNKHLNLSNRLTVNDEDTNSIKPFKKRNKNFQSNNSKQSHITSNNNTNMSRNYTQNRTTQIKQMHLSTGKEQKSKQGKTVSTIIKPNTSLTKTARPKSKDNTSLSCGNNTTKTIPKKNTFNQQQFTKNSIHNLLNTTSNKRKYNFNTTNTQVNTVCVLNCHKSRNVDQNNKRTCVNNINSNNNVLHTKCYLQNDKHKQNLTQQHNQHNSILFQNKQIVFHPHNKTNTYVNCSSTNTNSNCNNVNVNVNTNPVLLKKKQHNTLVINSNSATITAVTGGKTKSNSSNKKTNINNNNVMNCTSDIKKAVEFGNGFHNERSNKSNSNNTMNNKTLVVSGKTSASSNTRNTTNRVNTTLKMTNAKCKKGYTDICKVNTTCSLLHSNTNNNNRAMSIHNHSLKQIKQKHNCCINNNIHTNQLPSYCGNRPNSVAKMKYSQKTKMTNRII